MNTTLMQMVTSVVKTKFDSDDSKKIITLKMLLHDAMFSALAKSGCLEHLVFHGGTALQRVYGSPRLSEDFDFICTNKEVFSILQHNVHSAIKQAIDEYSISADKIIIKSPEDNSQICFGNVQTWKIHFDISIRQTIKIDLEYGKLYDAPIVGTYKPLTELYTGVFVNTLSKKEILANKVVAVLTRNRLQWRDVFDIQFLSTDTTFDEDIAFEKCLDRKKSMDEIQGLLVQKKEEIELSLDQFTNEMLRFLPNTYYNKWIAAKMNAEAIKTTCCMLDTLEEVVADNGPRQ